MIFRRKRFLSDDELDSRIRAALRHRTEPLSPPPEVWQRIHARIQDPAQDRRLQPRWTRRPPRPVSLLQGAVLAVLLLGMGLNFWPGMPQGPGRNQPLPPRAGQARVMAPQLQYPDDMLTLGRLFRLAALFRSGNVPQAYQ